MMLFTVPRCRWTYFSGSQTHITQSFELLDVSVCKLCDWTHTHLLTPTQMEPVFLHMGPRWGKGKKKKRTGWQKLEWESVVLQLTSPKGKGCCMPLQSSGERCTRRDSAARNARLLFLVRGGNTNASRVSFKVGFTWRVFKAFLHHTRLATSQSVSIKAQLSMMFVQRLEIS